jgi:preprotein translocase subunit SecG
MYTLLLFLLALDALILVTAVLLQAGQGGGLASLGGGAGTEQFMGGRQATTLLTKITWWCAGIFLFVSLILAVMSANSAAPRSVLQGNVPAPAPVQTTPLPLPTTPPAQGAPQQPKPQPPTRTPPPHR